MNTKFDKLVLSLLPSEFVENYPEMADALNASISDAMHSTVVELNQYRETLERLAVLTPLRANAHSAEDLYQTVRAIANSVLNYGKDRE